MPGPEQEPSQPSRFLARTVEQTAGVPPQRPLVGVIRSSDIGAFGSLSPRVILGNQQAARQAIVNTLEQRIATLKATSQTQETPPSVSPPIPVLTPKEALLADLFDQREMTALQDGGAAFVPQAVFAANQQARQALVDQLERRGRLLQEAEAIRAGVQASLLFELPRGQDLQEEPRFLDVADIKDPLRPSSIKQDIIATRWKERLSRLTNFQRRLRQNARWQAVESRFLTRIDELTRGLFSVYDPRRRVFTKLAAYLSDEEMRTTLLSEIDRQTSKETEFLLERARKKGGELAGYPLLIVGTGWHGTNAAIELQATTLGKTLAIDASSRRGGLFRTMTPAFGSDIPAFEANSRDNRRQVANLRARAGGRQNLNPFSDEAPIQTVAFDRSSYPGNHLFAAAVAVNSYLAGPTLQGARLVSVRENPRKRSEEEALLATVRVGETTITIPAFGVEIATGLGTFTIPNPENDANMARVIQESRVQLQRYLDAVSNRLPKVVTGQDFFQMAVTRKADLFRSLINKVIVIAGKRDTAQSVISLLTGEAPDKRLYGDYVTQEGVPNALYWIGPEADNRQRLKTELALRPRYSRLLVDYPRDLSDINAALFPVSGKVTRFGENRGFRQGTFDVQVRNASGGEEAIPDADLLISCTGQINDQTTELLFPLTRFAPLRTVVDEDDTPVFREASTFAGRVMVVGPAANLPVSNAERKLAPDLARVGENSASIWLNTEKVSIASRELARRYNRTVGLEVEEDIPF